MVKFHQHKPEDILLQAGTGFFPAKTQPRTPGRMNLTEFKQTVSDVLMTEEYDDYLEKLFMKVRWFFVCIFIHRGINLVVRKFLYKRLQFKGIVSILCYATECRTYILPDKLTMNKNLVLEQ